MNQVSVKPNQLSKREQEAKKRLFSQNKNSPPTKQSRSRNSSEKKKENQSNQQFKQVFNAPSNNQIDAFLKNIENDFQQTDNFQEQVTFEMLSNQQHILKQQNEILNQNQQHIANIVQQNPKNPQTNSNNSNDQQSQLVFRNLLQPINDQLREIKEMHQQTQNASLIANKQLQNGNSQQAQQALSQFSAQNGQLKNMLDTTQHNLTFLQPEHFQAINSFSNFNLQVYADTITSLQKQIQSLQQEQEKVESDLNLKYKRLNDARLNYQLNKQQEPADDTKLKEITEKINQIDHTKAWNRLHEKLGGEFDYDGFLSHVTELQQRANEIYQDNVENAKRSEIDVPSFGFDEKDLQILSQKNTSILDEIKAQLGLDKKPLPKPEIKTPKETQKMTTQKPASLQNMNTSPIQYPKDITFAKEPKSYDFLKPPQQQQPSQQQYNIPPKLKSGEKQRKPKSMEKDQLVYKKPSQTSQQKQVPKQNYGVIEYMNQDDSQELDQKSDGSEKKEKQQYIEIKGKSSQKKQKKQQFNQKPQEPRKKSEEEEQIHYQPNFNEENNLQAEYQSYLTGQYQVQQENTNYINYDQLMREFNQGQGFQLQEVIKQSLFQKQKNPLVLQRLGMESKDEMLNQIAKDFVKEKLQSMIEKPSEVKEQKLFVDKGISTSILKEQPISSGQDPSNQGQQLFQGFLQGLNNALAQVNQGILTNLQNYMPPQFNQSEVSNSDDSEIIEPQSIFQSRPMQVQLGPQQQQVTFAQDFNPSKVKSVNLKEYYKEFEIDSSYIQSESNNKSGRSQGSQIFAIDQSSLSKKSDGQVSLIKNEGQNKKPITKGIFEELSQDFSDGEVPIKK